MSKDSKRGNHHVLNTEGRYIRARCVMYCRETREYVGMSCSTRTMDRFWAWSGTREQAKNAARVFGIGPEFVVYLDGQEVERV